MFKPQQHVVDAYHRLISCVYAQLLRLSWKRETSDPIHTHDGWTPDKPECGQSAVTALLVQERLGGEILMMTANNGRRHFYNRLANGYLLDFVLPLSEQTPHPHSAPISREALLRSELHVESRFDYLKDRFNHAEEVLKSYRESLRTQTPT